MQIVVPVTQLNQRYKKHQTTEVPNKLLSTLIDKLKN